MCFEAKEIVTKKLINGIKEEMECAICRETLLAPNYLDCGHVYCKACLEQWAEHLGREARELTCPSCRDVSDGFSPEPKIGSLIDILRDGMAEIAALQDGVNSPVHGEVHQEST